VATACRCKAEAEAVPGVRRGSVVDGAEEGRGGPLESDVISPAAAETLLVKEEMAQPAHDAASLALGWGVLMRGAAPADASVVLGGGRAVSAIEDANLRIRWR
jgi:hypothetical protein